MEITNKANKFKSVLVFCQLFRKYLIIKIENADPGIIESITFVTDFNNKKPSKYFNDFLLRISNIKKPNVKAIVFANARPATLNLVSFNIRDNTTSIIQTNSAVIKGI